MREPLTPKAWCQSLLERLHECHVQDVHCDTHLVAVDGDVVTAHACVLVAASPTLSLQILASRDKPVMIQTSLLKITIEAVLSLVYTGSCQDKSSSMVELQNAAMELGFLQLPGLYGDDVKHEAIDDTLVESGGCKTEPSESTDIGNFDDDQHLVEADMQRSLNYDIYLKAENEWEDSTLAGEDEDSDAGVVEQKMCDESTPTDEFSSRCTDQSSCCRASNSSIKHKSCKGTLPCTHCSFKATTPSRLKIHEKTHIPRTFKCDICERCFTNKYGLKKHHFRHTDRTPFHCRLCPATFPNRRELKMHETSQHDIAELKPYQCPTCGNRFIKKTGLKTHQQSTHAPEKKFLCKYCAKSFVYESAMNVHERRHLQKKAHKCEECDKAFILQHELKLHILSCHTTNSPFKCQSCEKVCSSAQVLKAHMLRHTGERPFMCDICGAGFIRSGQLKGHVAKHTGIRPYKCNFCPKAFFARDKVKRHELIHTKTSMDSK